MDEKHLVHVSQLINNDKVFNNYDYICNIQTSITVKGLPLMIESMLYSQLPKIFCKKIQIQFHLNVDLSSHVDKYLCIERSQVQIYMVQNLDCSPTRHYLIYIIDF